MLLGLLACATADARMMSKVDMRAKQAAAQRFTVEASAARGGSGTTAKNITFSNPRASGECSASVLHLFPLTVVRRILC